MDDLIKLHLGCGPHIFPGWRNFDIEPGPGGIKFDLREGVPALTHEVDFIFTEHFIEHLTLQEGQWFLKECYRVLKSGGVLRISTPDLWTLVHDYEQKKIDRWADSWKPATPCEMLNEGMREWGHKFLYDSRQLAHELFNAGFQSLVYEEWRGSKHETLRNLEIRPFHDDLIVEATKL